MIFSSYGLTGEEKLEQFINYLNDARDTIQFTLNLSKERIEFLDVEVINESVRLETDVYVKLTVRENN